jgi:hypothetical protein
MIDLLTDRCPIQWCQHVECDDFKWHVNTSLDETCYIIFALYDNCNHNMMIIIFPNNIRSCKNVPVLKTSDLVAHHIFRLENLAHGKNELERHWSDSLTD